MDEVQKHKSIHTPPTIYMYTYHIIWLRSIWMSARQFSLFYEPEWWTKSVLTLCSFPSWSSLWQTHCELAPFPGEHTNSVQSTFEQGVPEMAESFAYLYCLVVAKSCLWQHKEPFLPTLHLWKQARDKYMYLCFFSTQPVFILSTFKQKTTTTTERRCPVPIASIFYWTRKILDQQMEPCLHAVAIRMLLHIHVVWNFHTMQSYAKLIRHFWMEAKNLQKFKMWYFEGTKSITNTHTGTQYTYTL